MESTPKAPHFAGQEGPPAQEVEPGPQSNEVVVDLLRHGMALYGQEKELLPEGERQVAINAQQLVESVDPDRDLVVLWSSPNPRAQESTAIIRQELESKGIPIYKDSIIRSMRAFDRRDQQEIDRIWGDLFNQGLSMDQVATLYMKGEIINPRDPRYPERRKIFEGHEEVRRRTERVVNWIRYFAEHVDLTGKRLRIMGVSHGEFINPILEDIFAYDVEREGGIGQAEPIRLSFQFDPKAKQTAISAEFRGQTRTGITFDREQRKFIVTPDQSTA
jgi:broad specificity phosphatase PhoE